MTKFPRVLLSTIVLLAWPVVSVYARSQSSSQQSPPTQQSQTTSQPQSQATSPTQSKDASVADAAKKSGTDKPKPKKVYTEDDLSSMGKGGVSVVGSGKSNSRRTRNADADGDYGQNSEEYWRSRSQPILDAIAETDAQIEQLKEDIKKYGNGGFDVQTGMKDNIAYIHDRNGQIQQLEKHKADLKKQLEDLEEEGRKAGAQPAWFR
jgi:hypothetical protein